MKVMITGSYDPITLGHIDIINRACALFDEVVIAVLNNEKKQTLFSVESRCGFIEQAIKELKVKHCKVVADDGLAVDCARKHGCDALVRGVRSNADYEYEVQQASINKVLDGSIETIFMLADAKLVNVSSTLVKVLASYGADLHEFVPLYVEQALSKKFPHKLEGTQI